jgi:hypothetical protein
LMACMMFDMFLKRSQIVLLDLKKGPVKKSIK